MKEGDNVYFFHDRKIYGIGKLTRIGPDCKFQMFPNAGDENVPVDPNLDEMLADFGIETHMHRVVCFFEPDPYFFNNGIDMDDVLASNPPEFRILRAIWKRSFIKFDDNENQAFKDIILKRNIDALSTPKLDTNVIRSEIDRVPIERKIRSGEYDLDKMVRRILGFAATGETLRHEMALEMGMLHQLAIGDKATVELFGDWDYLSHQVIASPFKPIDYMDRMDVFGYSFIPDHTPTINRYLVAELKKDQAITENADQLLRYVDWLRDEYSFGDYSLIQAFLVAKEIPDNVIDRLKEVGIRRYTIGVRPTLSLSWFNVKTLEYSYNQNSGKIDFNLVWDSTAAD
jgi:hypothetical protein